jgi:heptaprenyl diphosphate synthase
MQSRGDEEMTASMLHASGSTAPGLIRRARVALYAAAAALLFVLEPLLPSPVPWLRLGLANVVTLVVLLEHGPVDAAAVLALRLVLGGLFAGTLHGPQFVLAAAGGAASWATMSLAARYGARVWSAVGISLAGAAAHAVAQIATANSLLGGALWSLLPLFLALAAASGCCTGLVAESLRRRLHVARRAAP